MAYYLMLAETRDGYEVQDTTSAGNARQAKVVFKERWQYLVKPRRYGRVLIVRCPHRCFNKKGEWF